jgi:hypothetical protein
MGLLDGLKGLLGRGAFSESGDLILLSLGNISSELAEHLSTESYRWNAPREIKTFECLIFAKFLLEHALEQTYRGKLSQIEFHRYQAAIEARFRWLLENTFQNRATYDLIEATLTNRCALYREVMAEESHPICWQILAEQRFGRRLDLADRRVDLIEIALARDRQPHAGPGPVEQRCAQEVLEVAHLVADRRLRHAEAQRSVPEPSMNGGGMERAQRSERRQRGLRLGHVRKPARGVNRIQGAY